VDSRWAYKWYNIFIPRRVDSRWVYKWYNIFIPRRVIHDGHTSGTIYIYHGGYINDEHTPSSVDISFSLGATKYFNMNPI
jgi:hypothetical protein